MKAIIWKKSVIVPVVLAWAMLTGDWALAQFPSIFPTRFGVVNLIPNNLSAETDQNAEPSLAVGSGDKFGEFVVHAFSMNFFANNPYLSSSGNPLVWVNNNSSVDGDATLDWSPGGTAYATTLATDLSTITVLSASDPTTTAFTSITTVQGSLDQPWIRVVNANGTDHIYVGYNNLGTFSGQSASVRFSLDGGTSWQGTGLEQIAPVDGQDSPAIRLAVSADGQTVYALFQRWNDWTGDADASDPIGDVVLVRDDNQGLNNFGALPSPQYPNNNTMGTGTAVASDITLPSTMFEKKNNRVVWVGGASLGKERLGAGCDVAVNPLHSGQVYVAYTERGPNSTPSVVVQYSSDAGNTFTVKYVRYSDSASSLPSLAVAEDGTLGLLYAVYDGISLEVHFLKAYGGDFQNIEERVLARFPNNDPPSRGDPYIGDYFQVKALGNDFFGTFAASGAPLPENFPSSVYYQRNVRVNGAASIASGFWLTSDGSLVNTSGSDIKASIDPFFFYDLAPWWWFQPRLAPLEPSSWSPTDPLSGQWRFRWPVLPTNYPPIQLESSPQLGPAASWTLVTNVFQTNGMFEAPFSFAQGGVQFFRQRQNISGARFQLLGMAGSGGALSPSGLTPLTGGQSQIYTATPSNTWAVASWYLDGAVVRSNTPTLTVSNITADHTVLVTFAHTNDLAVSVTGLPVSEGPAVLTNDLAYEIRVANVGLAPCTGVTLSNVLPQQVLFVTATNSQGTLTHSSNLLTAALGTLNPGAFTTVWLDVIPQSLGPLTNTATVACSQFEPNLTNNTASDIQTVVAPLVITSPPVSQIVSNGTAATFTVGVAGTASLPFVYEWFHTNSLLVGETNATLTLTNVTPAQAGAYSVTVLQVFAPEDILEAESQPATLTVH
jgi:uncharacterized repeat protein (TIGR01451 family)